MGICNSCLHKPVCARYIATGGHISVCGNFMINIAEVKTNIFDQEEVFHNCTVQVLTNTATGEVSVGWWRNGN